MELLEFFGELLRVIIFLPFILVFIIFFMFFALFELIMEKLF